MVDIKQDAYFPSALGLTLWNLSCLEFKFDDTKLSKNKIGKIEIFLLLPDFANFLSCWPAQFWWDSQQGRELSKSGSNKKISTLPISYVNRKVWYHQLEFQTT